MRKNVFKEIFLRREIFCVYEEIYSNIPAGDMEKRVEKNESLKLFEFLIFW